MYYDTQRKLAFVMPPRTGSTTFSSLLEQWNPNLIKNLRHAKPSEIQIDGFEQYSVYGFFRNPLDRFLSLLRQIQTRPEINPTILIAVNMSSKEFRNLNYDQLVNLFPLYENVFPFYFHQQNDWLVNATLLNFNNYTSEILRVARMFDITQVKISVNNWTDSENKSPSKLVVDFVQSYYSDDYRLGREKGLLT